MMTSVLEILHRTEGWTADEQLTLATRLIEQARRQAVAAPPRHKWTDALGAAPYPLLAEDAQEWISRTRAAGDEEREKQWGPRR